MSMKRYEKYKPSGIEWIDELPEHWEVKPIKASFSTDKGLGITKADLVEEGIPVISYGQIHSKLNDFVHTKDALLRFVPVSIIPEGSKSSVGEGDFVFADTSEDVEGCGNCLYIEKEGIYAGYHTVIARSKSQRDNRYLAFLFSTPCWRSQIRAQVYGVKVFSVTQQILKSTKIIVPPIAEQKAIAAYLEARCGDIDKVVATQEKRIALLNEMKQSIITQAVTQGLNLDAKMKDSGVEWIGMVPEHWEVKKLKFVVSCNDDVLDEKTPKDTVIRYVEISDVDSVNGVKNFTEYEFKNAPSRARRITKVDDVIVSTVRTYLKAIARIKDDDLIVSTGFAVLRAKDIDVDYLAYCSLSQYFIDDVISESVGVSYPAINASQLVNIKIALPGINEQKEIADYLNQRCAEIDKQIGAMTRQIELLREYKQSLITEVVTGKRKVC